MPAPRARTQAPKKATPRKKPVAKKDGPVIRSSVAPDREKPGFVKLEIFMETTGFGGEVYDNRTGRYKYEAGTAEQVATQLESWLANRDNGFDSVMVGNLRYVIAATPIEEEALEAALESAKNAK